MDFILDPPTGVGALKIGMAREEMGLALEQFGTPIPFARGGSPLGWRLERPATIFTYCDGNDRTDAIEFATPGRRSNDHVLFRGIDLFRATVAEVLDHLNQEGVEITEREGGYTFAAMDLLLSLWRNGEPCGPDGMPKYFEAALIARPGYFDGVPTI